MHGMDDDTRKEVLGEVVMDELKVIREYLEYLMPVRQRVEDIDKRLVAIESDVKIIKLTVTDHSKQLYRHEQRLNRLELNDSSYYT